MIGGGSGHEPLFHGLVGKNMADAAACGEIFAAPTPDIILRGDQGGGPRPRRGSLYGNYAGDNMNFDMAAEMPRPKASRPGRCASGTMKWLPRSRSDNDRRGIAGDIYIIKIAGGAAATIADLDEVERVASKARANVRSIGVAVPRGLDPGDRQADLRTGGRRDRDRHGRAWRGRRCPTESSSRPTRWPIK